MILIASARKKKNEQNNGASLKPNSSDQGVQTSAKNLLNQ